MRAIVEAEVTSAQEMAQRYLAEESTLAELRNATPFWKSMPPDLSFLGKEQGVAARRALTLHFELQVSGDGRKAQMCVQLCEKAIQVL